MRVRSLGFFFVKDVRAKKLQVQYFFHTPSLMTLLIYIGHIRANKPIVEWCER